MDKFSATKDVDDIEMTNNPSSKGNEFFCRAILDSNLDEVIRLIEQVDVNTLNCNEGTPLYGATRRGNLEVVNFLLDHGADPNKARTDTGETPIQAATRLNHPEIVKLMSLFGTRRGNSIMATLDELNKINNNYDTHHFSNDLY